jgi:hypothetical protein
MRPQQGTEGNELLWDAACRCVVVWGDAVRDAGGSLSL